MNPRKILFMSTSYADTDRRLQRIISTLIKDGNEVSWISRVRRNSFKHEDTQHVFLNTVFSKGPLFYLEYNIRAWLKCRKLRYDMLTAIDLDTIAAGYYASKSSNIAFLFDAHEYFSEVPELLGKNWKKAIWKRIASYFIPKTDKAYTVGQELANLFSKIYAKPFEVIRNVPFLLREEDSVAELQTRDIIYLGVLNKGRGLEQLIETMTILPAKYRLILLGDGDIVAELKSLVEHHDLVSRVIFKGLIAPDKINHILKDAWCGINLLDNKSLSYYYSLANKYFDYLHAGLPIIANDFPEYSRLNKEIHTSILIDSLDERIIKQAILSLEDEALYKQLKNNTTTAQKAWNWNKESSKLLRIYNSL